MDNDRQITFNEIRPGIIVRFYTNDPVVHYLVLKVFFVSSQLLLLTNYGSVVKTKNFPFHDKVKIFLVEPISLLGQK